MRTAFSLPLTAISKMRRSRRAVIPAAVVLSAAALSISACAGSSATTTTAPDASASINPATGLPAPELQNVRVATNGSDATEGALLWAKGFGLYQKYGLNASVSTFSGASNTVEALEAGQVDAATLSGGPVLDSLLTSNKLVAVAVFGGGPLDYICAGSKGATAASIKGHAFAISSYGSTSDIAALDCLKTMGLSPTDVTFEQVGNGTAGRLAAVVSGSVAISDFDSSDRPQIQQAGLPILVDLSKQKNQTALVAAGAALVFTQSFVSKYPNTVLNILAAALAGEEAAYKNPKEAGTILIPYGEVTASDALADVTAEIPAMIPRDGVPTLPMFANLQPAEEYVDKGVSQVNPAQAFTTEFVNKLKTLGFYTREGIPTS